MEMDLYTYLKTYEPQELVHFGGSTYCTREHDSLKISNGKWYWFSRRIGGRSALDYLIKVKELLFIKAVERIAGCSEISTSVFATPSKPKAKALTELLTGDYVFASYPPPSGKDCSDYLCHLKGISKQQHQERSDAQ